MIKLKQEIMHALKLFLHETKYMMTTILHPWHGVSYGEKAPRIVTAVIEIPQGSRCKYEIDKNRAYLSWIVLFILHFIILLIMVLFRKLMVMIKIL